MKSFLVLNSDCFCKNCDEVIVKGDFVYHFNDDYPNVCGKCLKVLNDNVIKGFFKTLDKVSTSPIKNGGGFDE